MTFMNYILKQKQNTLLKDRITDKMHLNHWQEYELFSGHFNPIFEAIWVIAQEHFTNEKKTD